MVVRKIKLAKVQHELCSVKWQALGDFAKCCKKLLRLSELSKAISFIMDEAFPLGPNSRTEEMNRAFKPHTSAHCVLPADAPTFWKPKLPTWPLAKHTFHS